MPLSVMYSNGGNSQGHLFKPARPIKTAGEPSSAASTEQRAAAQARPVARSAIDSTGIGTAHIMAALTVYMSTLATASSGTTDAGSADTSTGAGQTTSIDRTRNRSAPTVATSSGAADLLRVLDAYAS